MLITVHMTSRGIVRWDLGPSWLAFEGIIIHWIWNFLLVFAGMVPQFIIIFILIPHVLEIMRLKVIFMERWSLNLYNARGSSQILWNRGY
jgi:hypothetical protein